FVPGLAEGPPQVESLSRRFALSPNAYWSSGEQLTVNDVRSTVELLNKQAKKGIRTAGPRAGLLQGVRGGADPLRVTVQPSQGYIEALALMTFKIVPDRLLNNVSVDSKEFAREPVSSGPFQFGGTSADPGGTYVSFIYNPVYGSR